MSSWKASGEVGDKEKNPKDLESSRQIMQRLPATRHKMLEIVFLEKEGERYLQGRYSFFTSYH